MATQQPMGPVGVYPAASQNRHRAINLKSQDKCDASQKCVAFIFDINSFSLYNYNCNELFLGGMNHVRDNLPGTGGA